jgi:hypothetical protein
MTEFLEFLCAFGTDVEEFCVLDVKGARFEGLGSE